jgi:hypothetical protein
LISCSIFFFCAAERTAFRKGFTALT